MKLRQKNVIKKIRVFYLNYRRVTAQTGLTQLFKMDGYGLSGDKNLKQTFASEGSGAVRVDFDCILILHVEAIKQKAGKASLSVYSLKMVVGNCTLVSYLMMKTQEKRGI